MTFFKLLLVPIVGTLTTMAGPAMAQDVPVFCNSLCRSWMGLAEPGPAPVAPAPPGDAMQIAPVAVEPQQPEPPRVRIVAPRLRPPLAPVRTRMATIAVPLPPIRPADVRHESRVVPHTISRAAASQPIPSDVAAERTIAAAVPLPAVAGLVTIPAIAITSQAPPAPVVDLPPVEASVIKPAVVEAKAEPVAVEPSPAATPTIAPPPPPPIATVAEPPAVLANAISSGRDPEVPASPPPTVLDVRAPAQAAIPPFDVIAALILSTPPSRKEARAQP